MRLAVAFLGALALLATPHFSGAVRGRRSSGRASGTAPAASFHVDQARLHRIARRAVRAGRAADALRCYDIAGSSTRPCPKTFCLKALLCRRLGAVDGARAAYGGGVAYPNIELNLF